MLMDKNIHNYAAVFQDPAFDDGNIFTPKNDLCYDMVLAKHSSIWIYITA